MMTQTSNRKPGRARFSGRGAEIATLLEARFFKALCDPTRLAILADLVDRCGSCTVTEAATCCPTDVSVVSRHLALLRDAGIVQAEKRGKEVHYTVRFAEFVTTLRALADAFEACCPAPDDTRQQEQRKGR